MKNKKRSALDYLIKAIQRGYDDREHIDHYPDLDSLRDDPEVREIVDKITGDEPAP